MKVRRFAPFVAAVALVAVTACEKPAPQITVASSGRVVNVDASRYCFAQCRDHATATTSIRVRGNTTVSIDVPKQVAEKGWILVLGKDPVSTQPLKTSHYALGLGLVKDDQAEPLPVTIFEFGDGASAQPTGAWKISFLVRQ